MLYVAVKCFITLRIYKVLKPESDRGSLVQFYHIKNLQSTKTSALPWPQKGGFITLRIYKVLKPQQRKNAFANS